MNEADLTQCVTCDCFNENDKLKERIKELEDFLKQLDMCEVQGETTLILKPIAAIYKDIKPRPNRGDSVILLTCAKHSDPQLFLKIVKTILKDK